MMNQLEEIAGYLWQKGWAERNGGNISINLTRVEKAHPDKAFFNKSEFIVKPEVFIQSSINLSAIAGHYILITGTGKRMRDVAKDYKSNTVIVHIHENGKYYSFLSDVEPSSELPSHLLIHNYLSANNTKGHQDSRTCIVHTHPTELVAMSHHQPFLGKNVLSNLLWSMIPETRAFCPKGLGVASYKMPGSMDLAKESVKLLDEYDVVLWQKHGVLATAENILEAFDMIDVLNKSAMIYKSSREMGFVPDGLSQKEMKDIARAMGIE
ncbi:MAG: rhamnulose-1-phosphate aldolase [Bacteroidales bacterium]